MSSTHFSTHSSIEEKCILVSRSLLFLINPYTCVFVFGAIPRKSRILLCLPRLSSIATLGVTYDFTATGKVFYSNSSGGLAGVTLWGVIEANVQGQTSSRKIKTINAESIVPFNLFSSILQSSSTNCGVLHELPRIAHLWNGLCGRSSSRKQE